MQKINFLKELRPFITKNEPTILMCMGISGFIFSIVSSNKATIKATKLIEEKKKELNVDKLDYKETIKLVWKLYLPAGVVGCLSIPCIVLGNNVSNKRNAALAAAYTLSETALQEYQDATKEIVGDKKEKEIHEEVSKKIVEKTYNDSNIILTGDGDTLFYEPISGRYFKSNWNKILRAANELNASALNDYDPSITLTQWFNQLGLDSTCISGDYGWSMSNGTHGLIKISIDSSLTPDNVPCGSIYYDNRPEKLI